MKGGLKGMKLLISGQDQIIIIWWKIMVGCTTFELYAQMSRLDVAGYELSVCSTVAANDENVIYWVLVCW